MHRTRLLMAGLVLVAAALTPLAATAATIVPTTPAVQAASSLLQPVQYGGWSDRGWRRERDHHYGRYCARLRRACVFKEERGEAGEGNCRRYRRECGRRQY